MTGGCPASSPTGSATPRSRQSGCPLAADGADERRSSSARTAGTTSVPSSSTARSALECGRCPTLTCAMKRWWPKSSCWNRIFSTTSCGLQPTSAPRNERSCSNCSRVFGDQPRSRPNRFLIPAQAGKKSSAASCDVSATNVCELIPTGSPGWPASLARRVRGTAHREPDGERLLHRAQVYPRVLKRRAVLPGPRDLLGLAQLKQQLELLGEQLVVVVEVVAEERKRLDEGAAPRHDLRAPAGEQVHRGEVRKDPHGVVRAQHGNRTRQPDPFSFDGRRAEDHGGRGDDEVWPVVLTDAEHIEPNPLSELDLLHQIAHPLRRRYDPPAVRVGAQLGERVEANLHAAPESGRQATDRYPSTPGARSSAG